MLRNIPPIALLLLTACVTGPKDARRPERFEFEEPQMGVPFRIVLYASGTDVAEAAATAAFQRISELNSILSDYNTDSEIMQLSLSSEEGAPSVPLSRDMWTVLHAAQILARRSEGAFDVTVGPSVALWRKARREKELPEPERLERARAKVGYENLVLNSRSHTARLLKPGMRLDAGGIAKGYAADEALKTLRKFGIRSALVAASGDLSLGDPPPGEKGWRVEIAGYDEPGGPPSAIMWLANRGIATSGDLFQRLEIGGMRYSHILNPFTGVGMTNHALATVIADNCMTADMLATTSTILEPEKAFRVAGKYGAAVRVVQLREGKPVPRENRLFTEFMQGSETSSIRESFN